MSTDIADPIRALYGRPLPTFVPGKQLGIFPNRILNKLNKPKQRKKK